MVKDEHTRHSEIEDSEYLTWRRKWRWEQGIAHVINGSLGALRKAWKRGQSDEGLGG